MKPARSRCTGGRNASISTAKMVGGQAWGSSTVFPWAFLKGFAASSLQVLGDVAGDGMRRAPHPRIVAVPPTRQRARGSLAPHATRPAPQPGIRLGRLLELDQQLERPLGDRSVRIVRFDA